MHLPAPRLRNSGGRIMSPRCQKLLDSSTHILNLILWMPKFRGKLVVLLWSVIFSSLLEGAKFFTFNSTGKDEHFFFCNM